MSLITPANRQGSGKGGKFGVRRAEINRIYAHPLPVTFPEVSRTASKLSQYTSGIFNLWRHDILNPHCHGIFDPATRSVWVINERDSGILWRRGFFGKGDLSRSETSWKTRQINARKAAAGKYMTPEELREKRRAERKQFKFDRAAAMARAAAEAEAAFAEGRQAPATFIPSGATWKPQVAEDDESRPSSPALVKDEDIETEDLENVEHLQLTLQEAFFLSWCLDCLTVLDPVTLVPMSLQQIWTTFQNIHNVFDPSTAAPSLCGSNRFDNPFLIQYVAYHHYRSLGWVVKGGIKFCVDLLLYKRGPVFHHAEFAILVLPVYEDPADKETSPHELEGSEPFSWSWLSTVNRVNSQVQKTLILTYVTIPAQSRCPPDLLSSPACIAQYSVRDVILRRFIPARMRD